MWQQISGSPLCASFLARWQQLCVDTLSALHVLPGATGSQVTRNEYCGLCLGVLLLSVVHRLLLNKSDLLLKQGWEISSQVPVNLSYVNIVKNPWHSIYYILCIFH